MSTPINHPSFGASLDKEEEPVGLYAREYSDGWTVIDPDGGHWWPHDEAAEQIGAATDPAVEAVRLCMEEPMRGKWVS